MQSAATQGSKGNVSGMIAACVVILNVELVPAGPSKYASIKKPRQNPAQVRKGARAHAILMHMFLRLALSSLDTFRGKVLRRNPFRVGRVELHGGDVFANPHDRAQAGIAEQVNLQESRLGTLRKQQNHVESVRKVPLTRRHNAILHQATRT
jgi:hypothetical protein